MNHHHHHQIVLITDSSLTLSRSLSLIVIPGRSSRIHPVSTEIGCPYWSFHI